MTNSQTIDGVWVSRDLLRDLVEPGMEGSITDAQWDELRALLDKEVSGDSRAPLPQGEPVAIMNDGREGEPCIWFSRPPNGTKLYAEQPAPVAVGHMCDCNQGRLPCRCKP